MSAILFLRCIYVIAFLVAGYIFFRSDLKEKPWGSRSLFQKLHAIFLGVVFATIGWGPITIFLCICVLAQMYHVPEKIFHICGAFVGIPIFFVLPTYAFWKIDGDFPLFWCIFISGLVWCFFEYATETAGLFHQARLKAHYTAEV